PGEGAGPTGADDGDVGRVPSPGVQEFTIEQLVSDLEMAVFICCQKFSEAAKLSRDPKLTKKLSLWKRRLGDYDPVERAKLFREYQAAGQKIPHAVPVTQRG